MGLHFPSLLFHNAAQFAFHRLERVMDDFFERLVCAVVHLLFFGDELVTWRYGHVDSASVRVALVMRVICLLNRDIAAVDMITKSLQSC